MKKSMLFKRMSLLVAVLLLAMVLTGCATTTTTSAETTDATGSSWSMLIIMVVMIAVFYFLLIRPENKRKKQQQEMRNELAVGDTVTTIGGIVGKIVSVKDNFIVFETGEDRVRIQVAKWAISTKGKATQEENQ